MKHKKTVAPAITPQEIQLIEQLRQHPEIGEQLHSILEIVRNTNGPLKSADEVEELLIEAMRQLGSATLHQWAAQAEARLSNELRRQDPTVRSRKKKR